MTSKPIPISGEQSRMQKKGALVDNPRPEERTRKLRREFHASSPDITLHGMSRIVDRPLSLPATTSNSKVQEWLNQDRTLSVNSGFLVRYFSLISAI